MNGVILERDVYSSHRVTWRGRGAACHLTGKIRYKQLEGTKILSASALMLVRRVQKGSVLQGDTSSGTTGESKAAAGSFAPRRSSHHQQSLFWDNYLIKTKPR